MKHKLLTFALMGALASTMLFSCQNSEEPIPSPGDINSGEMVEYSISVNIPDEMRTRDSANASIGETGLYEFENRIIDKVWYAVYYDNVLKTTGEQQRSNEQPFEISYRMTGSSDPSKLCFFFWAGNVDDQVSTTGSPMVKLDYNKTQVTVNQAAMHDNGILKFYDSFAGYYQFADKNDNTIRTKTIILKRPFSLIHIITDDFTDTDLGEDYPNGFTCFTGFGNSKAAKASSNSYINNFDLINTWNYKENTYSKSQNYNFYFQNDLKLNNPQRVTFKNREMDYLTCFFTFPTSNDITQLNLLVFEDGNKSLNGTGSSIDNYFNSSKQISLLLPEGGFVANTQYIIYNKKRSEGGTGFLEAVYNYKIIADNDYEWDSIEQSEDGLNRI